MSVRTPVAHTDEIRYGPLMTVDGLEITVTRAGEVFATLPRTGADGTYRRKIGTVRRLDAYEVVSGTAWRAINAARIGRHTADTRAGAVAWLVRQDVLCKRAPRP